jgi:pre-mRNA-processing factor 39
MEQDQSVAAPESGNPEAGAAASSVAPVDSANASADANLYIQNSASANPDASAGIQYPDSAMGDGSAALPYNGAQGADGSVYPTEHASMNGTAGQAAGYQAAGATENGDEMSEPMVPEQSYEDGNAGAKALFLWFWCLLFCC